MLPTFVIGLREGLEAALIVGIIAAFLRKQGRRDLLRWVFVGVGVAVLLCIGVGIALEVLSDDLPQRQQEGLETVVGVLAVGMVTYMVVWMRRHSRELKGQLEGLAADAMAGTSSAGRAMVAMAFLAVLREGFETVVFLLAAFNESSSSSTTAGAGALIGIVVAVALGYGIYRGGVRINLSKFFRITGTVLVLVAAGLVVTALHTAHEAGWLNSGQGRTVDLTSLVRPGSVQSSLLTGMLGVQQYPVVIEIIGWLVYLVPVGLYVAWPPGRGLGRPKQRRLLLGVGAAAVVAGIVTLLMAPGQPGSRPPSEFAGRVTTPTSVSADRLVLHTSVLSPASSSPVGPVGTVRLTRIGDTTVHGLAARMYRGRVTGTAAAGRPTTLTVAQIAALQHGRLPIGLNATTSRGPVPTTYADTDLVTAWVAPSTGRVLDLRWSEAVTATVSAAIGRLPLATPVASATTAAAASDVRAASARAQDDLRRLDRRSDLRTVSLWCFVVLALALAGWLGSRLSERRPGPPVPVKPDPALAVPAR
jgi:high-affinity iron transporter